METSALVQLLASKSRHYFSSVIHVVVTLPLFSPHGQAIDQREL